MSLLQTATNIILHILQKVDAKNISISNPKTNRAVLTNVQYIEGHGSDDLKMMEHPIEDGSMIVDHIIDDPKSATVKIKIDDEDSASLSELQDLYKNRTPLVLKIKNEIYPNLCISSKPVSAAVENFNSSVYDLTFKEAQEAQTVYVKMKVPDVKNPKNASTIKTGQKVVKPKPKGSILRQAADKLRGVK